MSGPIEPTATMLYGIADALGHSITRGYHIHHPKSLELGPISLTPDLRWSHTVVDKDFIIVGYKIAGDLYASFAYEESKGVTTVLIIDKEKLLRHMEQPKGQLTMIVNSLASRGKIATLDGYISEMRAGIKAAAFRQGSNGEWVELALG